MEGNRKMINLINPVLFDYAFPWGNHCNKTAINLEKNVHWLASSIVFDSIKEPSVGWIKDETTNYAVKEIKSDYSCGLIVSKDQHGYGVYTMKCKLPNFRGSWVAFWLYDVIPPPQGIQCEVDFEHFRKDACPFGTRRKLSFTFHDGDRTDIIKNAWSFFAWDRKEVTIQLILQPDFFSWAVGRRTIQTIYKKNVLQFPTKPMNIIVNSGFGNWGIQDDRLQPLVVTEFTKQ